MKKRFTTILAVMAVAAAIVVPATPASATASGGFVFECVASLPAFPSSTPNTPGGTCGNGTVAGQAVDSSVVGTVSGLTSANAPYVATPDLGAAEQFHAEFTYSEECVGAGGVQEPPLAGVANGTAFIEVEINSTEFTGKGTIEADFSWTRVGLNAAIVVENVRVKRDDSGATIATNTVGNAAGVAEATFVPFLTAGNTCPDGDPIDALVVGQGQLAG